MAKKEVVAKVKLQCPAGAANPAPPVGPALSQHQVNIGDFVKRFNADTAKQKGMIIPVIVEIHRDKSFDLVYKSPPTSVLLKKMAGLPTDKKPGAGSKEPHKIKVGKVTKAQVLEIAQLKIKDLNTTNLDAACRTVEGTARNMGIEVV
jgi:large subunit ribosomal protein L11